MKPESSRSAPRGRASALVGVVGAVLIGLLLSVLVSVGPARSITWAGPSEVVAGQSVTVQLTTERDQPYSPWRVALPTGWTFVDTPTWVPPTGGAPQPCDVSGGESQCPPAADNGDQTWLAGSTMTMTIRADTAATAGVYAVRSDLGDPGAPEYEDDSFEVLIRPAPPIFANPAEGSSTTDRTPELAGTAEPGATVRLDGGEISAEVAAGADGDWNHVPDVELAIGEHVVAATQMLNGVESEAVERSFTITPDAPTIDAPADGSRSTDRTPTISGTSEPGATVTLVIDDEPVGLTAGPDGVWTHDPVEPLSLGRHDLSATQTVNGLESSARTVKFRIEEPADPPSTGSPPPRPRPPTDPPSADPQTGSPPPRPSTDPSSPRPPTDPPSTEPSTGAPPPPAPPSAAPPSPARPPEPASPLEPSRGPNEEAVPGDAEGTDDPTEPPGPASPQLPMRLSFADAELVPGYASRMTGVLGPNTGEETLELVVNGTLGRGALYRTVEMSGGECAVTARSFTCTLTLAPGSGSELTLLVLPDAIAAPDLLVQRITVTGGPGGTNVLTHVTEVDGGPSDTESLADQISTFPGPTVGLLALHLFALAAAVAGGRRL